MSKKEKEFELVIKAPTLKSLSVIIYHKPNTACDKDH